MYDDILGKEEEKAKKEEGKGKKAKLGISQEDKDNQKPARIAPTPPRPTQGGEGLGTPIAKKSKNILKQPQPKQPQPSKSSSSKDNKCPECGLDWLECECDELEEFDKDDKWDAGGKNSSVKVKVVLNYRKMEVNG